MNKGSSKHANCSKVTHVSTAHGVIQGQSCVVHAQGIRCSISRARNLRVSIGAFTAELRKARIVAREISAFDKGIRKDLLQLKVDQ